MKQVVLTPSQLTLTTITYGTGGRWDPTLNEANIGLIRGAYERGIRSFDTAQRYDAGRAEEVVGAALRDVRGQCVISTKLEHTIEKFDDILRAFEGSLKRLGTDYVDIYYVHWPAVHTPVKETMKAFRYLKEQKLIRAIGVSNFSLQQLEEAISEVPVDVIQLQYSLLVRDIEKEITAFCLKHAIGIFSYSATEKGLLSGHYRVDSSGSSAPLPNSYQDRPWFQQEVLAKTEVLLALLAEIAAAHHASMSQIAIAWLLHQKHMSSVIIGTRDIAHIEDNIGSTDIMLSDLDVQRLDGVSRKLIGLG